MIISDSKPVSMTNGNDDEDNDDDGYDLSPPAKKPSPAVMLPLPGMAGRVSTHLMINDVRT